MEDYRGLSCGPKTAHIILPKQRDFLSKPRVNILHSWSQDGAARPGGRVQGREKPVLGYVRQTVVFQTGFLARKQQRSHAVTPHVDVILIISPALYQIIGDIPFCIVSSGFMLTFTINNPEGESCSMGVKDIILVCSMAIIIKFWDVLGLKTRPQASRLQGWAFAGYFELGMS